MMSDTRPGRLRIGAVDLDLPIFFPSVSSVKTALSPLDYVRTINALSAVNGQFLVSAFDLDLRDSTKRQEFQQELAHARGKGTVILMDSGNYESFWKDARSRWVQTDFHRVLAEFPCHLAFGFDEQEPRGDFSSHLQLIVERHAQDQAAGGAVTIIPVIHGTPEELPALCAAVTTRTNVTMVAVPERRLGDGVFERARAVTSIRQALNKMGRYVGLHLLGTGNPISLALYSVSGVDSFDGLEWCQTVVDHESGLLFHLSQADFFAAQTKWSEEAKSFQARVLAHNLEFYTEWMKRLRGAIHDGLGIEFCRLHFPTRVFVQCAAAMGWETNA